MKLLSYAVATNATLLGVGLGLAVGGALTVAVHGALALSPKR